MTPRGTGPPTCWCVSFWGRARLHGCEAKEGAPQADPRCRSGGPARSVGLRSRCPHADSTGSGLCRRGTPCVPVDAIAVERAAGMVRARPFLSSDCRVCTSASRPPKTALRMPRASRGRKISSRVRCCGGRGRGVCLRASLARAGSGSDGPPRGARAAVFADRASAPTTDRARRVWRPRCAR